MHITLYAMEAGRRCTGHGRHTRRSSHSVTTRDRGMSSVRRVHGTAVVAFVVFRLSRLYNIFCNNWRLQYINIGSARFVVKQYIQYSIRISLFITIYISVIISTDGLRLQICGKQKNIFNYVQLGRWYASLPHGSYSSTFTQYLVSLIYYLMDT